MPTPTRCASCGATLAPSAQWCSLCLTPVPAPQPPAPAPQPPAPQPPARPLDMPSPALADLPPPTTPPVIPGAGPASAIAGSGASPAGVPQQRPYGGAAGDANPAGRPSDVDPDAMLAELAATESKQRSALSSALSSRLNRFLLGAAVMAVLLGAFLLVSLVLARFTG